MYPLQLVPTDKTVRLTLRRSCPTAAADQGRELQAHLQEARQFVNERPRLAQPVSPPALTRGQRRSWQDTLVVLGAIERLWTDARYPLVRRLVHGLRFCELLGLCRLDGWETAKLRELTQVLAENVPQEAAEYFQQRTPPSRAAAVLFRQIAADYLRLHPRYLVRESWRERLRMLTAAVGFARGKGAIPRLHPDFPEATFEAVEQRTLGHLDEALQKPFVRFFETTAVSGQYAIVSRLGWSVVEKFRATAVAYAAGHWMLRYFCPDRPPTVEDAIDIVTAMDRGQGYEPLAGHQHRRRVKHLAQLCELERLVVWYAQ
jgi:hypothetical protein